MKKLLLILPFIICSFTSSPFTISGEKVIFKLKNADLSPITITISDTEHRVVYKQTFKNKYTINKIFNFEKAFSDTYTIKIKDNCKVYTKIIEVNH